MLFRPAASCLVRGREQMADRALVLACLAPVVRERLVRLAHLAGRLLQKARDGGVPLAARGARQPLVRDVADQRVLERELLVAADA